MALRLAELSPREFEELCVALLKARGHETRHLGAGGSEGGWDVRSTDADGRLWCTQCKRVQSLPKSLALKEEYVRDEKLSPNLLDCLDGDGVTLERWLTLLLLLLFSFFFVAGKLTSEVLLYFFLGEERTPSKSVSCFPPFCRNTAGELVLRFSKEVRSTRPC